MSLAAIVLIYPLQIDPANSLILCVIKDDNAKCDTYSYITSLLHSLKELQSLLKLFNRTFYL